MLGVGITHCLTWRGGYPVDDAWLRSHPHIWEEEGEEEEGEEDEGDSYCEVGEHWTTSDMMWPNFADCKECTNEKDYAEYMGISREKAEAIGNGWDDGEEGKDEDDDGEKENDEASKEEEERMRWLEYDNSFESEPD